MYTKIQIVKKKVSQKQKSLTDTYVAAQCKN